MLNQTVADELLILVAGLFLLFEIYALFMVRVLRRKIDGGSGDYLLRVVYRFGFFVVLGQSLTVLNAVLRFVDTTATYDTRLLVLLFGELVLSIAFLWTVWEIHHLPVDRYGQHSPARRPEQPECLCKEINDTVTSASAPVDQCDCHAPTGPL